MQLSEDLFDFLSLEFGEAAQGTAAPAREEPTPVEEDFSGFDVDFMENKDMGDSPVPDAWEFDEDLAPPMTSQYAIEAPGGGAPKSTAPGGTGSARASARQPSSRLRSARGANGRR